jgi:hypothetical protein
VLPLVYLVGAFVVGAVLIALAQRWRRSSPSLGPSASDQMAHFRTLYEQGVISEEEYRRLRTILGGELRRAIDVPPPLSGPGSEATAQFIPAPEPPPPESDQPPASGIRPA